MITRALVFLGLALCFLLRLGDGLGAQQQDVGSAARRVIIFVWDGLRADDVTPENMPNYFALARSGVARHIDRLNTIPHTPQEREEISSC